MSQSKLTDSAKVLLVLASFGKGSSSISEFCANRGVARSTFYAWRKAVVTQLATGITRQNSRRSA